MNLQCTPYSGVLMITAFISAAVAVVAWRRHSVRGGTSLALMMAGVTEWTLMAALEAATVEQPARILWSKLEYIGSNSAMVFLLLFALEYTRRDAKLTRRNMALLWIVPVLNVGLVATNEWHRLIWTGFSPGPSGSNLLIYHHGPGFWLVMASVYAYVSAGTCLLVRAALRPSDLHRRQGTALLVAAAAPWVGSVIYLFGLSPIPGLDIIPLSFLFTGLVLMWGIFRAQLLDLVPVARDTLIEHMNEGVLVLDAHDRIVDINPSARRLLGEDGGSPIGLPIEQVLEAWSDIAAPSTNRGDSRGQAPIEVALGKIEPRFMDVRISPLYDQKDRYVGKLVILHDITERKRAKDTLQKLNATLEARVVARTADICAEKEKVETILRSVDDAIIMADLEMQIQYVNRAFTTLTGYTIEEVLGRPIHAAGVGAGSEQILQSIATALSQGNAWQGEVESQSRDGRIFDAALTVAPVYGADGQLEGCVSSLRDISQQKRLEQARARFMTNVSHELRTPVASIKLHLHLLKQERQPEATAPHLQALTEETARLEHLILDILELVALDSGKGTKGWEQISLPSVVEGAIAQFRSRAEAKGLTLKAPPGPPDLPPVRGNRSRLLQALQKLMENAVIFTPEGGEVIVEISPIEEDGQRWVTIAVQDTGPGIPAGELEQIFNRFYRGHLAEMGHVPGAGLGLSIVKAIMQAHGGRITVKSEIGQGSTFTLWLRSAPDIHRQQ